MYDLITAQNTRDPVPPERWEMLWRDLKSKEPRLAKEMLASNLKLHGANVKSISVDKGTQVDFGG